MKDDLDLDFSDLGECPVTEKTEVENIKEFSGYFIYSSPIEETNHEDMCSWIGAKLPALSGFAPTVFNTIEKKQYAIDKVINTYESLGDLFPSKKEINKFKT
jgi:hypothetical protein